MGKQTLYPDVVTHRRQSVFPEHVQIALKELGESLRRNSHSQAALETCLDGVGQMPARDIVSASSEIRELMHFGVFTETGWWAKLARVFDGQQDLGRVKSLLARKPDLARLMIFHGSGYVRQAALESIVEPPENDFEFAALVYRMNDWVPQVRTAAADAFRRLASGAPAEVIATSSMYLLLRTTEFGRWSSVERNGFDACMVRPDVAAATGRMLMGRPPGRVGTHFRLLLRNPFLDMKLQELAEAASLPLVRAVAHEALITRKARWSVGQNWRWVDKRHGIKERGISYERRPVQHDHDLAALIRKGSVDRSIVVRRTVARAMVEARDALPDGVLTSARKLADDPSASVRVHADFFLRNFRQPDTSRHRH